MWLRFNAHRAGLVIAAATVGCGGGAAGNATSGPAIYAAACATCHGAEGRPPEAMIAQLGVRDLTSPTFAARAERAAIVQQIRRGSANKLMPAFDGALTEAQIEAVTAHVLALATGQPPPVPPAPTSAR